MKEFIEIINNLRNKSSDIDGVCRGKEVAALGKLLCKCLVAENCLYTALCIVEVTFNCTNTDI